ncbi:MAG: PEP-CTERM sorting domain-containing protein [Verrucomicrobia bacterium]|nr:PEP-CTERM sorting domain-containing protein [Verrucomicrobiota bacterium]
MRGQRTNDNTQRRAWPTLCRVAAFALSAVAAHAGELLSDTFSYSDGPIVGAAGSLWIHHSGNSAEANVAEGQLQLTQAETEDISAVLPGAPFTSAGGGSLYAGFTLRFDTLPTKPGTYFAHFKNNTTGFRARVFTSTLNAGAGSFRLGIGNGTDADANSGQIATDLTLGLTYSLVVRYDLSTAASTLWLNPAVESDPSVTAADASTPIDVTAFAFRQSSESGNGMGGLVVDNLRLGTTFVDVVPEPATWALLVFGLGGFSLARRR